MDYINADLGFFEWLQADAMAGGEGWLAIIIGILTIVVGVIMALFVYKVSERGEISSPFSGFMIIFVIVWFGAVACYCLFTSFISYNSYKDISRIPERFIDY